MLPLSLVFYILHRSQILGSQDPRRTRKLLVGTCMFASLSNLNFPDVCGTVSYLPPEGILAMDNHKLGYVSTGVLIQSTYQRRVSGWYAVRLLECRCDPIYHARVRHSFWSLSSANLSLLHTGVTTPSIFREDPLASPGGPPPMLHRPGRIQSPRHTPYHRNSLNLSGNLDRPLRKAKVWSRNAS